jgi:hypothetical protein
MALGVTLPHSHYFYGFDGLRVLRDEVTKFKVFSDPRAFLCALERYHGVKHVLCTLRVLKDGETEFMVRSDPRALLCALGRYHGVKHVLYTLGVLIGLSFLIIRVSTGAPGLKDRVAIFFTG